MIHFNYFYAEFMCVKRVGFTLELVHGRTFVLSFSVFVQFFPFFVRYVVLAKRTICNTCVLNRLFNTITYQIAHLRRLVCFVGGFELIKRKN